MTRIVAVVGTAGGVGTTRLTVECGATLARAGYDVAVVDTAFGTQGLRAYVDGEVTADVTALLTEEASLGDVLYDVPVDVPGRLALAPARSPFERLARAQTAGAAQRLERQLAASSLSHDVVLVDTPPIEGNHAVAAVNAAEQIGLVTPDTPRGRNSLALMRARLDDIGETADVVLRDRATDHLSEGVPIPESDVTTASEAPVCTTPDEQFAPAVAEAAEELLDVDLDLEFPSGGRLGDLRG
jgi:septum site-determining protein MinD